jgi:hypothetical protein
LDGLFATKRECAENTSQLLKFWQQQGRIRHSQILLVMYLLIWQSLPIMSTWCGFGAVGPRN